MGLGHGLWAAVRRMSHTVDVCPGDAPHTHPPGPGYVQAPVRSGCRSLGWFGEWSAMVLGVRCTCAGARLAITHMGNELHCTAVPSACTAGTCGRSALPQSVVLLRRLLGSHVIHEVQLKHRTG